MSTWTIVVAAGSGTRFGGPKQFAVVGGQRVIDRSVATARLSSDGVVVVAAAEHLDNVRASVSCDHVVSGGATRSESVRAGLAAVPSTAEVIVVHDAARPLAARALFTRVIDAVRDGADAAIPGVPLHDTIKRVQALPTSTQPGTVIETVNRSELVAVQTPQAFRAQALRLAHASALDASDDAGLIEAAGGTVVVVLGSAENVKITVAQDLRMMESGVES